MKKRMFIAALTVLVAVAILSGGKPVRAQDYDPDLDLPQKTKFEKSMTKLGRGFSNILFGWAEIPVTFDKKVKEGKPLAYLFGVAPVLGTAKAVIRTGTGVFETVTFSSSPAKVNYEPLIEPEYIF